MKSPILLSTILTLFVTSIFGQIPSKDLVRADIVLDKNKPTIYLCVDSQAKSTGKNLQQNDSDFVWFQLHNNTIWALAFRSEEMRNPKAYKLADGRNVMALEDKAVSTPLYQIEYITPSDTTVKLITDKKAKKIKQPNNNKPIVRWGDVNTGSWMLSGSYTSFNIPKSYFSERRLIYVEYKYQWEMIGTIGYESYSPSHRVYTWFDLDDSKSNLCVS